MRNTEQPQMAQYNWRTSGAVSIMTKEKTNMNNTELEFGICEMTECNSSEFGTWLSNGLCEKCRGQ